MFPLLNLKQLEEDSYQGEQVGLELEQQVKFYSIFGKKKRQARVHTMKGQPYLVQERTQTQSKQREPVSLYM